MNWGDGGAILQFKVHGVDAQTGKKVAPLDIAAPDLREAATLAKIRGVLPTRITPVTELLTVVKKPEPGTDGSPTKRTTLISIEGRPLWFAATLIVAVILAVLWFVGPKPEYNVTVDPAVPSPLPAPKPAPFAELPLAVPHLAIELPVRVEPFAYSDLTVRAEAYGELTILLEITNKSGTDYSVAVFTISFYDETARLFDTAPIFFIDFIADQTRSFKLWLDRLPANWTYKIDLEYSTEAITRSARRPE